MEPAKIGELNGVIRLNRKLIIVFLLAIILTLVTMLAGWVGNTLGFMLLMSQIVIALAIHVKAVGAQLGLSKGKLVILWVCIFLLLGFMAASWYALIFELPALLFPK